VSDRPPFDFVRAAFWLVAFVIAAHVVLAVVGASVCLLFFTDTPFTHEIINPRWKCDADNRLFDLLAQALSSALAFAAGRLTAPPDKGGKS